MANPITAARTRLAGSVTGRNTVFALGAEAAQLVLSFGSFFLLARAIGVEAFGLFAAATAHAMMAAAVGYVGSQQLLMRDKDEDRPFAELWGRLLSTVLAGTVLTVPVLLGLRPFLLGSVSPVTYVLLVVSQMLFFGLTDFAVVAAQAHRRLDVAMRVRISTGVIRLAGVVAFFFLAERTLASWAWFGFVVWGAAAVAALMTVRRSFGAPPVPGPVTTDDLRRGAPFIMMAGTSTLLDSMDRTMLAAYGREDDGGVYAAGYRVAALSVIPVMALVRATDQDFFSVGRESLRAVTRLAIRLVQPAAAFGVLAAIGLYLFAPVFTWLLREDFAETTAVIRWLAVLPLLRATTIFPANALTGADRQGARNAALIGAAGINFVMNLWLIPQHGWRGAVGGAIVAELFMAAVMWGALLWLARREGRAERLEAQLIEEYGPPGRAQRRSGRDRRSGNNRRRVDRRSGHSRRVGD